MSNTICWDDLSIALHDLSIDEKQEFLEGYSLSENALRRLAPVIKALNIVNYPSGLEQVGR